MLQVGAGTMNPATFLRVVGPEKWNTCYVEPSVRPDDSRYGENPNRLQQHTQMQVNNVSASHCLISRILYYSMFDIKGFPPLLC